MKRSKRIQKDVNEKRVVGLLSFLYIIPTRVRSQAHGSDGMWTRLSDAGSTVLRKGIRSRKAAFRMSDRMTQCYAFN